MFSDQDPRPSDSAETDDANTASAAAAAGTDGAEPAPASDSGALDAEPLDDAGIAALREAVIETLKTVYDPEIPVDIYELGLIYSIDLQASGACSIEMTLTSPACPVAGTLPPEVEQKVAAVPGVGSARVDVVWDPPWTQDRMSEAAQLQLGFL